MAQFKKEKTTFVTSFLGHVHHCGTILLVRNESLGPATLREERGVNIQAARVGSGGGLGCHRVPVALARRRHLALSGRRVAKQPECLLSAL